MGKITREELAKVLTDELDGINTKITDMAVDIKSFGVKGDGVADDTVKIQSIINNNPTKTIYFPDGDYLISQTITISNKNNEAVNIVMSKNARIFTNTSLDYLVKIGVSSDNVFLSNNDRNNYSKRCFVGGVLDCNGVANACIGFANYIGFTFKDTTLMNFLQNGMDTDFYYGNNRFTTELYATNINIIGQSANNNDVGILNRGQDNHFTNIFIFNAKTSIYDYGGGRFDLVHSTVGNGVKIVNSVFAHITNSSNSIFDKCYSDTYQNAFVNDSTGVILINKQIFYNYTSVSNNVLFVNNSSGYFIVNNPLFGITTNNYTIAQLPSNFSFDSPSNIYLNQYNINGANVHPTSLTSDIDLGLTLPSTTDRIIPNSYVTPVSSNNYVKALTLLVHNQWKYYFVKIKINDFYAGNYYEVLLELNYQSGFSSANVQIGSLKIGTNDIQIVATTKPSEYTNIDEVNIYLVNTSGSSMYNIEIDASSLTNYCIALNRDATVYSQTPSSTLSPSETKIIGWSLLNNASV